MKLLYSPNSPYARVARVCALYQSIEIEFEAVGLRQHADAILDYNPAAMVPTLVLDDGLFLTETRVICEYFETLSQREFVSPPSDLVGRHREGLANNFLDGVAVWDSRNPTPCR